MAKKKGRWAKAALGQVIAEGMGYVGKKRGKKKGRWLDPAEAVVRSLATNGAQSVPDVVRATGFRLTPTLRALHELQEFGLVKIGGEDKKVTLTAAGTSTATAIGGDGARKEPGKALES